MGRGAVRRKAGSSYGDAEENLFAMEEDTAAGKVLLAGHFSSVARSVFLSQCRLAIHGKTVCSRRAGSALLLWLALTRHVGRARWKLP